MLMAEWTDGGQAILIFAGMKMYILIHFNMLRFASIFSSKTNTANMEPACPHHLAVTVMATAVIVRLSSWVANNLLFQSSKKQSKALHFHLLLHRNFFFHCNDSPPSQPCEVRATS